MEPIFDLAVLGGGINGTGCAADAALRGLSVCLCERGDLASGTSSSSSKLIHGGLRYLEQGDFKLVKKALDERQRLLDLAPHLVHPLPLCLPIRAQGRPSWQWRLGFFIYDKLSFKNRLPASRLIQRPSEPSYFDPLMESYQRAFLYYDGTVDDARLTITDALQAEAHGATILPRTALTEARVQDGRWYLTLKTDTTTYRTIQAKAVINATGPWVNATQNLLSTPKHHALTLIKGSHIILPACYDGNHAYVLPNDDKRLGFVMPFHGYTMIGTTEIMVEENTLQDITIDPSETSYLCELVNRYFKVSLKPSDVVHAWSGVRPLLASKKLTPSALSRDYAYAFSNDPAPAVTVYGGKLTTYRRLASEAVSALKPVFKALKPSQTALTPLPGSLDFKAYQDEAAQTYHWLPPTLLNRYLKAYGTRTDILLNNVKNIGDLGMCFGQDLYQREVNYLCTQEWARTADDILWRRTKLGLRIKTNEREVLEDYCLSLRS